MKLSSDHGVGVTGNAAPFRLVSPKASLSGLWEVQTLTWNPHWSYRYKLAACVRNYSDGVDWIMQRAGSEVWFATVS